MGIEPTKTRFADVRITILPTVHINWYPTSESNRDTLDLKSSGFANLPSGALFVLNRDRTRTCIGQLRLAVMSKVVVTMSQEYAIDSHTHPYRLNPHPRIPVPAHDLDNLGTDEGLPSFHYVAT